MGRLLLRFLRWIIHRIGTRTLIALVLLWVALGSAATGLARLVRGLESGLLLSMIVYGTLIGWLLAKSRLPTWASGIFASIAGALLILLQVGQLGDPLAALIRSLFEAGRAVLSRPLGSPLDIAPLASALSDLGSALSTLLIRARDWTVALINGQAGFDPVAAALVWSLVMWIAAVWAAWAARRHSWAWQGVAPAGALLAIAVTYSGADILHLITLLGAAWLLYALVTQADRERRWHTARIEFSSDIPIEWGLTVIGLTSALVLVAALAPSISLQDIIRSLQRPLAEQNTGKQVADALGLIRPASAPSRFDQARSPGLPRDHLIGSGAELSKQVVMTIQTNDLPPQAIGGRSAPRYYWRSLTYDRYTGRGWIASATETVRYGAGDLAVFHTVAPDSENHRSVRQKVRVAAEPDGLLYAAGELATADQEYDVAWRSPGDAFGVNIEATTYQADSLVSTASEDQLRAEGSDYPDWVRTRYLALPDSVPERVLVLARDLTATEPTRYDRALAIERYLRAFPYTLDLPAPPPKMDVVDYFLFDLKTGYCDYYASAMVVLARAAGLPARLVTGYASGSYDLNNANYIITEADAHSWAEVYFPGSGWIEFEPTGGRPPLDRSIENAPPARPQPEPLQKIVAEQREQSNRLIMASVVSVLALGSLAWWLADVWRLRRMSPAATMATLYDRLHRQGRHIIAPTAAGYTPNEFASAVSERVAELTGAVRAFTDLYVRGLYSPQKPDARDKDRAMRIWHRLRWQLWLARVKRMRVFNSSRG